MVNNRILDIFRLPGTVFTAKEIALVWGETDINLIKSRLNYYVRTGKIIALRRGIYARIENYNPFELANKIFTPSYISLQTVLLNEGIIFQNDSVITSVSYLSRAVSIGSQNFQYQRMKPEIVNNRMGISFSDNYYIASRERAFLDMIYLNKDFYFDNCSGIDFAKVKELLPIYNSQALEKRLYNYLKRQKNA